jgi:hypothetical protein
VPRNCALNGAKKDPETFSPVNFISQVVRQPGALRFHDLIVPHILIGNEETRSGRPRDFRTPAGKQSASRGPCLRLISVAQFDTQIASYDGKFTYWAPRPSHLDPSITTLFSIANHPCYPSNGAAYSRAPAEVLAYLFPQDADAILAKGVEQGWSRIWAGNHFPSCFNTSRAMALRVAQKVIAWAENDGSR